MVIRVFGATPPIKRRDGKIVFQLDTSKNQHLDQRNAQEANVMATEEDKP
jgi:hypothetical protein